MKIVKALSFLAITFLISCTGNKSNNKLSGIIKIDGSSTVYPITEAIAEEFRALEPDVKVTVGVSGTGGGFKKFGRGEIDIANVSRPIRSSEKSMCEENNIQYLQLAIAMDGIAVVINPQNDWITDITVDELRKIWEPAAEGKINKWSDIRAGWPDKKINLYGPDPASGTYDFFTEVIVGETGKSRGDYTNSSDDNVLVQGISTDKFGLAFFGLAYYEENMDKLKVIGVNGGNGVVIPTYESVSSNNYMPLSRQVFIYVTQDAAKRQEVKKFVEFYLDNAGKISKDVGYVSLPAVKYQAEKEKFIEFSK